MRTLLTQGHAQNLRDLILNFDLDREGNRIIDFSYGKGGYWKVPYPYRFQLVKTDAVPTAGDVVQKNVLADDYSDLGQFEAGVFDPPYKYGHQVFNYQSPTSMQKQGKNSWGNDERFSQNKNPQEFIERVKALDKVAGTVIKKCGILFAKVMDVRHNGKLIPNHILIVENLTNFELYATYIYLAAGAHTWVHPAENAHGYWLVFKRK